VRHVFIGIDSKMAVSITLAFEIVAKKSIEEGIQ